MDIYPVGGSRSSSLQLVFIITSDQIIEQCHRVKRWPSYNINRGCKPDLSCSQRHSSTLEPNTAYRARVLIMKKYGTGFTPSSSQYSSNQQNIKQLATPDHITIVYNSHMFCCRYAYRCFAFCMSHMMYGVVLKSASHNNNVPRHAQLFIFIIIAHFSFANILINKFMIVMFAVNISHIYDMSPPQQHIIER